MKRFLLLGVATLILAMPVTSGAHSAGNLDRFGCHPDKRYGSYHCHRGSYQGIEFPSKAEFMRYQQAGTPAAEVKQEVEAKHPPRQSLFGPLLDEQTRDQRAAGSSELVVPQGIEKRLAVLDDLHKKGLITDSEYEQKRKEILGTL